MQRLLETSCYDIIMKNMGSTQETLYLLYDTESPLAKILSDAYIDVFQRIESEIHARGLDSDFLPIPKVLKTREFTHPPQPLYRGGLINPDNPHTQSQNRVVTLHNIDENIRVGLNHHEIFTTKTASETSLDKPVDAVVPVDPQIESIKDELIHLPKGSVVVLVQSTNFRLSTFRIRLELFHRGIHVVEHNHLAYIPEEQFPTFIDALTYRTPEYVRIEHVFTDLVEKATETKICSTHKGVLTFGKLERIRGNTGEYSQVENKGGTFPIGEIFTEAIDLDSVSGICLVNTYPNEDFSVEITEPFELTIEKGRVLPSSKFPKSFQKLYDWVVQYEGEVMVRELGFGLNPAISTATPLADINFHERKVGVHLSLGKKHGIYGKKLPKTDTQRFHIDVFLALECVYIGDIKVFENEKWIV